MYEIRFEPHPGQLMRHRAWQTQQLTLQRCHRARQQLGFDPIFGMDTALSLLGIYRKSEESTVTIVLPSCQRRSRFPQGIECRTWSRIMTEGYRVQIFDVWCTTAEATYAQMLRKMNLEENIVLADRLVCRDQLLKRTTLNRLQDFLLSAKYLVNVSRGIRALRLARPGTDSPAETRLRLELLQRGFPDPEVNYELKGKGGESRFLDLAYPQFNIALEYNGQHHLKQYVEDSTRLNALQSQQWKVFYAWDSTLYDEYEADCYFANVATAMRNGGMKGVLRAQTLTQLTDGRRRSKKVGR
ncbi:MAG: DUF559 domain-containing protein [Bifidobacterium sp.]|nr:DUF559 domain-containing protein [Bifidobacterium sp.]